MAKRKADTAESTTTPFGVEGMSSTERAELAEFHEGEEGTPENAALSTQPAQLAAARNAPKDRSNPPEYWVMANSRDTGMLVVLHIAKGKRGAEKQKEALRLAVAAGFSNTCVVKVKRLNPLTTGVNGAR